MRKYFYRLECLWYVCIAPTAAAAEPVGNDQFNYIQTICSFHCTSDMHCKAMYVCCIVLYLIKIWLEFHIGVDKVWSCSRIRTVDGYIPLFVSNSDIIYLDVHHTASSFGIH